MAWALRPEGSPGDIPPPEVNTLGAIELVGNLPAKMLVLLAQVTLGGRRRFSAYSEINEQLDELQGGEAKRSARTVRFGFPALRMLLIKA